MRELVLQLIQHVCGQAEFDEEKAYEGLEKAIDYDWQKRLVMILGMLDTEASRVHNMIGGRDDEIAAELQKRLGDEDLAEHP